MPTLTDVSDFLKDASIIVASCVAIYGINSWQREFVGKRRMELAEETLSLFYQARDSIARMRHPMSYGGEGSTRKQGPNETQLMTDSLNQAFVLGERLNNNSELFSRIEAIRFRFMAMLGADSAQPFTVLAAILNKLHVAVALRMREVQLADSYQATDESRKQSIKRMQETDAIYWSWNDESDPLKKPISEMIFEIERLCRPLIEKPGFLIRWRQRLGL